MERECNLKRIFLRSLADKTAQLNITECFSYSRFFSSAGFLINLNSNDILKMSFHVISFVGTF